MIIHEPLCGESLDQTVKILIDRASEREKPATAEFNGITLTAHPGISTARALTAAYHEEYTRRREAYRASPAHQQQEETMHDATERRHAALCGALLTAPATLTLRYPETWVESLAANTDPYGAAVLRYADRWARLMEARFAAGESLAAGAEDASHLADEEGMTGFMYGCAVALLAQCWAYGEDLRLWHNYTTQIHGEGDEANATGGVLNPALLRIG